MNTQTGTITRRELLKRGALAGGAVLWVTPVVQVVGMGRAYAKDVSPNCSRYCLRWDVGANDETGELTCTDMGMMSAHPVWTNDWHRLGDDFGYHGDGGGGSGGGGDYEGGGDGYGDGGGGSILTCPGDGVDNSNAAEDITGRIGRKFVVYGSKGDGFWVAFSNDIKLADLADESQPWSAAVDCGSDDKKFKMSDLAPEDDPCFTDPNGDPYRRIFIEACGGNDISHLELIIDWCS